MVDTKLNLYIGPLMKWISIDQELPHEGSLVYVKIPRKPELFCCYLNDSFGLYEQDFQVTEWKYVDESRQ